MFLRMVLLKKFKKVYIEITNVCNLSCSFCPKTKRPAKFMEKSLFAEILKQLRGHAKFVYFHVLGEPLLHPEIDDFLDLCLDNELRVNITTNGTLIAEKKESIINKQSLRQVNFSLHSFEANISQHPVDRYLQDVFDFIHEAREKTNIQFCLRLWNLSEGRNNENNLYILSKIEEEFQLDFKIEERLTPCNGINIGRNLFINQANTFQWPNSGTCELEGKGFCYGLREQVAILADGTVVPCCLDGEGVIALGNMNQESLEEILDNDRSKAMYNGFSRKDVVEPLCKRCEFRLRFNRP